MERAFIVAGLAAALQMMAGAALAESPEAARAREQLEPYRQLPKFQEPGAAFDARACMKGKSILTIPASSAVPFIKTIQDSMVKVAADVGFTIKVWENQGQVTQWVQGFDYAINNKFQLIDLLAGADPRFLEPQVKAAKAAGLMVVAAHLTGYEQPIPGGVTGVVPIDYKRAGALLADWAIWKADGKVDAAVMGVSGVLSTDSMVSGIKEEFAKCPSCKASYINVTIPEMAIKTQTDAQGALTADPGINYMIPIYDVLSQWVVPAVTITGRADKVKIATFNGTPFAVTMVQDGKIEMDIGESLGWIARSILDGYMRRFAGLPDDKELYVPLYIFDKSNAQTAGVPAGYDTGYGNQHVDGYAKLWKLK